MSWWGKKEDGVVGQWPNGRPESRLYYVKEGTTIVSHSSKTILFGVGITEVGYICAEPKSLNFKIDKSIVDADGLEWTMDCKIDLKITDNFIALAKIPTQNEAIKERIEDKFNSVVSNFIENENYKSIVKKLKDTETLIKMIRVELGIDFPYSISDVLIWDCSAKNSEALSSMMEIGSLRVKAELNESIQASKLAHELAEQDLHDLRHEREIKRRKEIDAIEHERLAAAAQMDNADAARIAMFGPENAMRYAELTAALERDISSGNVQIAIAKIKAEADKVRAQGDATLLKTLLRQSRIISQNVDFNIIEDQSDAPHDADVPSFLQPD